MRHFVSSKTFRSAHSWALHFLRSMTKIKAPADTRLYTRCTVIDTNQYLIHQSARGTNGTLRNWFIPIFTLHFQSDMHNSGVIWYQWDGIVDSLSFSTITPAHNNKETQCSWILWLLSYSSHRNAYNANVSRISSYADSYLTGQGTGNVR